MDNTKGGQDGVWEVGVAGVRGGGGGENGDKLNNNKKLKIKIN